MTRCFTKLTSQYSKCCICRIVIRKTTANLPVGQPVLRRLQLYPQFGWLINHHHQQHVFLKIGQSRLVFVYFRSLHIQFQLTNIQFELYKLKKVQMVCLGLQPWAAGWKVQTNPLSYSGTTTTYNMFANTMQLCSLYNDCI